MAFSVESGRVLRRIRFQFKSLLREMVALNIPNSWIKLFILGILCLILLKLVLDGRQAEESLWPKTIVKDEDNVKHYYDSGDHPFIFIGGHPRSGTTLMRAMLDSHSWVRCGEETRIIPRILQMRDNWYKSDLEKTRLDQAGVDESVVDAAVGAFILEAIAKHGHPTKVLCNKDPLTLKHGAYMTQLFPKSKWLFMIRDGRAVVHSVVTRKVTITGYQLDNPRQCLEKWNTVITNMDKQCQEIGPERCMVVYYEQLVLHPERWMTIILDFLDLPWDSSVLHHQDFINKKGDSGIRVSMKERSSDQIVKPINIEALTQWVGFYSQDVLNDMAEIAPMLSTFGYDPELNPPNYGQPDGQVVNNTNEVQKNKDFWEIRAKQLVAQMEKRD